MSRAFYPGWSPELAQRGRDAYQSRGFTFASSAPFADDDRPLPAGFSLSGLLRWTYDQGRVGSCFANMGAAVLQLVIAGLLAAGISGKLFNPSRKLIWYRARQLDGTLGSRSDGASIVNSFAAIGPAPNGLGDCSEELCPYRADHYYLEATPSAEAVKSADATRIVLIAEIDMGDGGARIKRAILNGRPVGIGIPWCFEWDRGYIDALGRTIGIGGNVGGHAVTIVGWLDDWDGATYFEVLNSHGAIYPELPADVAARIAGYKPSKFTFWVRADMLADRLSRWGSEAYIGSDVTGFDKREISLLPGLLI